MLKVTTAQFIAGYHWNTAHYGFTQRIMGSYASGYYQNVLAWFVVSTVATIPTILAICTYGYGRSMHGIRHAIRLHDKFAARIGLGQN